METILLVDDDEHVRPMIRDILELSGYNVLDASGGDRALEIVASHPDRIHLLLTDVMMPGLTGPELAHQLRPRRPGMKVLYMSGFTPADFRSRTIEFEPSQVSGVAQQRIHLIR